MSLDFSTFGKLCSSMGMKQMLDPGAMARDSWWLGCERWCVTGNKTTIC